MLATKTDDSDVDIRVQQGYTDSGEQKTSHSIGESFGTGEEVEEVEDLTDNIELSLISNRGVKVWPNGAPETFCTDNWRLRFMGVDGQHIKTSEVVQLISNLNAADMNFTNALMLHTFDGVEGFTKAQGE